MATIFEDNFNSYNDGVLNGQGSWSGEDVFTVQTSVVKEGAKAIVSVNAGSDYTITKIGTQQADGGIGMYMRKNTIEGTTPGFSIFEGTTEITRIAAWHNSNWKFVKTGAVWQDTGIPLVANTWHWVKVEWRSSDGKIRLTVDENTPSDWYAPWNAMSSGPDRVKLWAFYYSGSAETVYFDYIAEEPYSAEIIGPFPTHFRT